MTDTAALITAAGAVLVALVALLGNIVQRGGLRRDVSQIKEQVQNDHGTNLRHDIDQVLAHVGRVDGRVEALADDVALLHAGWRANREDIDGLMDTEQRRRHEQDQWAPPAGLRRDRRRS